MDRQPGQPYFLVEAQQIPGQAVHFLDSFYGSAGVNGEIVQIVTFLDGILHPAGGW